MIFGSSAEILTNRFLLRSLRPEDVNDRYAGWFGDQDVGKYIAAAASSITLADLQQYVLERTGRVDVLFLGIFERTTGLHIGNIKYEPVDLELKYAVMGILVGEPEWRGKGVAVEVIEASCQWLQTRLGIEEIVLGVARDHYVAICAYLTAGFRVESTNRIAVNLDFSLTMVRRLLPLVSA